ncbi:aldehyde dehydrogenase family protein [Aquirufa sp. 5-AUSEE-100C1]
MNQTTEERIQEVLLLQKSALLRLKNASADERIEKLKKLQKYMLAHQQDLFDALFQDFRKPTSEVIIGELLGVKREIDHMISHIRSWMKPQSVSTPLLLFGTRGHIQYEPKGLCLIIAPWNYPFNLAINPLVHAIAAGNAIILKPSEMSEHTSAFIKKMITALFDPSDVFCVEGDAQISTYLLAQKFDHIFFTGSPAIGKIVMAAAAKNLTSVTLELGGKSPAIIGPDADMPSIVQKIAWGKFLNNGQTCIAPDYVYVHEKVHFQFLAGLENTIQAFYNTDSKGIEQSKDYARIVNRRHFDRIVRLLDDAKEKGAKVIFGGDLNPDTNFISPTILSQCTLDMAIMQEEIFGPILPVLTYRSEEEIINYLSKEEKPLALYIFSEDKSFIDYINKNTSAGSTVVNDCLIQFGHPSLPFGGVNNSGIGKSGGKFGFQEFSHSKAVLVQKTNALRFFYPPYTFRTKWLIEQVLKWF